MQLVAARWAAASVAVGVVAAVAGLGAPTLMGAIPPTTVDAAVAVVLVAAATARFARREWLGGHLLAWAGILWSLTGLAVLVDTWALGSGLARLALLPHALVVVCLMSLPYGDLVGWRRLTAASAVVVALAAGAGMPLPALALLAVVCIGAGMAHRGSTPEAVVASLVLLLVGAGWAVLWWESGRAPLRTVADGVALVLLAAAAAVVLLPLLEREAGPDEVGAELGRRVGAVVRRPGVEVLFPLPGDPASVLDVQGRRQAAPATTPVRAAGDVVALLSPPVPLSPGVERTLARELAPLATMAALNDDRRRQAGALDESRRRLESAAAEERRRVEQSLASTVVGRLNVIESLIEPAGPARDQLDRVRRELRDLVAGLDPLRGRTLGEALLTLRGPRTGVQAAAGLDAPHAIAQAAWWATAEGVSNALKHAPGASIEVRALGDDMSLVVTISDDGPGGADPQGRGLLGAADRVAAVGGRLDVTSGTSGTTLRVTLPTGWPLGNSRAAPDPQRPGAFLASAS